MEIVKKCWKDTFEKIASGEKKFDIRLGDTEFNKGDILILKEFDPETKEFTGKEIKKKVGFMLRTKELPYWSEEETVKHGYVVIQLEEM